MVSSSYETALSLLYAALMAVTCGHILLRKKDSRSAANWLLLVIGLPMLGFILYLLFGMDRVRRRVLLKEAGNRQLRQEYMAVLPRQEAAYEYPDAGGEESAGVFQHFPAVLERICSRPLLTGNRIRVMLQGDEVYEQMLAAISEAKSSVHLQTYIFHADKVGRQIIELMAQKAAEGVKVRLLYDPVGSIEALWFLDELQHTRVQAQAFHPLSPLKRRFQVNLRNHRKLLVVDGHTAWTGGMNITEKHLIDHPLYTRVKDTHFCIEGPVVHQMQEWFVEDWYYASGEKLLSPEIFPPLRWCGEDLARVITSGPDGDFEAFYQVLFAAITGARKRIWIVTPYFIPDQALLTALGLAALRGVEITLLVPGHNDHPFMTLAARTVYEELLTSGVRIFERKPPFLHSKLVLVDGEWATIGSANMDIRSFRLNFEANLEVRSPNVLRALEVAIEDDLRQSRPLDLATFRTRPPSVRLLEQACGLFKPML
jgi:cardiolipin synthase